MKIKSITKIQDCKFKRYDIQTKNHNFFANGILVHNSIIKVVKLDSQNLLISTNGVIDAFKCEVTNDFGCPFKSYGELIMEGFKHYGLSYEDLLDLFKEGYTYMFELTSPWNQVVVKWDETKVSLIGIRDNLILSEIKFTDHELAKVFDTPKVYPLRSIKDVVDAANALPDNEEGYVVCDMFFNRIKVKSPRYLQLHYMAGNQVFAPRRVMDIIRANEVSEYASYFPKFKVAYDQINALYEEWLKKVSKAKDSVDAFKALGWTKKQLAAWVFSSGGDKTMQGFVFGYWDGKFAGVRDYVDSLRSEQICDFIGV